MYLCQWWRLLVSPMRFLQRCVDTLSSTTPRYHRWSKIFLWEDAVMSNRCQWPGTLSLPCLCVTWTRTKHRKYLCPWRCWREIEKVCSKYQASYKVQPASTLQHTKQHPKTISFKHLEGRTPFLRATFSKSDVESKTMPGKGTSLFARCYLSTYESNQQSTSW